MVLTLAYTGLRFGEAAALQVQSVDLERPRMSVTQAWASLNTGVPYLSTPKTHERRKVGLPASHRRTRTPRHRTSAHRMAVDRTLRGVTRDLQLEPPRLRPRRQTSRPRRLRLDPSLAAPHCRQPRHRRWRRHQGRANHKDAAMTLNTYAGLFPDRLDVVADALDEVCRSQLKQHATRTGSADGH
jgi:integrase